MMEPARTEQELLAFQKQIFALMIKIMHRLDTIDEEQRLVIQQYLGKEEEVVWADVTTTMLHVLDVIGRHEPINGIAIARQLELTKGGVSKITHKLLAYQLITKEMIATNKKEIYFRLTPLGRDIFNIHQRLHQEREEQGMSFLKKYTASELQLVIRFLHDFAEEA
jgi:DNA-binding MarR family transcriptional regulator